MIPNTLNRYTAKLGCSSGYIPKMPHPRLCRYDIIYPIYKVLGDWYKQPRSAAVELAKLKPGDVVLDLGCGTGRNFALIADRIGPKGKIIGVDISKKMSSAALERYTRSNVEVHTTSANRFLSQSETSFDAVFCTLSLSVMKGWENTLNMAFAKLKGTGSFVIMDIRPEKYNLKQMAVRMFSGFRADAYTGKLLKELSQFTKEVYFDTSVGKVEITVGRKGLR